jgi:hypothetical protein
MGKLQFQSFFDPRFDLIKFIKKLSNSETELQINYRNFSNAQLLA